MYQKHPQSPNTEKDFNDMLKVFFETICPIRDHLIYSDEWDMDKVYAPNWACIWNKPEMIGKKCLIIEKNDQLAVVQFKEQYDLVNCIFRLEDLTETT